jgi:hypothetical protein
VSSSGQQQLCANVFGLFSGCFKAFQKFTNATNSAQQTKIKPEREAAQNATLGGKNASISMCS